MARPKSPPVLPKSKSETKADVLLRVIERGRASIREAAIVLDKSWPTIRAHIDLGKIPTLTLGKRLYITLPELLSQGLVLPTHLPDKHKEQLQIHLRGIDANEVNETLGAYYD